MNRPASRALVIQSLRPVEAVVVARAFGARREREGVGAGAGFGERVGADGVARQAREVAALLLCVGPAQQGICDQCVLHIDDDGSRGIDPREFLDRQNRLKKVAALAAVLLRNLDRHQPELEQFAEQILAKHGAFIHLANAGSEPFAREFSDGGLKKPFFFAEFGEGRHSPDCRMNTRCQSGLKFASPTTHCAAAKFRRLSWCRRRCVKFVNGTVS